MKIVGNTESICPLCFQEGKINKINAQLIEDEKKIWMIKECHTHGSFRELYFNDEAVYNSWMAHKVTGHPTPEIKTCLFNDPPLYNMHISQPVLMNLVVTNRCNIRYPDTFSTAFDTGYVYELSFEHLSRLMHQAKNGTSSGSYAIQIIGGEPTLREDLFEILHLAKKIGFSHIQIHTNGFTLSENIEFCRRLKDTGIDTVYLRFDGVTHKTNPLLSYHIKALENLRNVNLNVVLEPMLLHGKNVHESGKIVRFALDHIDIVRGVHFVPAALSNQALKLDNTGQQLQRVDFIQIITGIEQEFAGLISRDDFYPIPLMDPLLQLLEMTTKEQQIRFTAHPCCGASTFLYMKEGKPLPIDRFVNVNTILEFLNIYKKKKGPLLRLRILYAFTKNLDSFIEEKNAPQGFDLKQMARETATIGYEYAMRKFYHKTLFVGSMWYQDVWNLDIDQLQRCVIHYITPEGIVPYCSYHGLGYGEKIQKKYSTSIDDWEKRTGRRLDDDLKKTL